MTATENNTPIEISRYTDEADIYRDAWRIADPGAANPVAVARTLFKASAAILHKTDTDGVRKHPALRVMAGQLGFLYGFLLGAEMDDYNMVQSVVDQMNDGKSLEAAKAAAEYEMGHLHD